MTTLLVLLCLFVAPVLALCAFIKWNPGAPMVLRTRKSDGGSFWGCSAYPRCRGIRDAHPTV